jgi:acyl-CoA thioesterase FadM
MRSGRLCLLGSLEAHQLRPIDVGEELIVVGWTIGEGRRSVRTASAIIEQTGDVVASARAVWVAIEQ